MVDVEGRKTEEIEVQNASPFVGGRRRPVFRLSNPKEHFKKKKKKKNER